MKKNTCLFAKNIFSLSPDFVYSELREGNCNTRTCGTRDFQSKFVWLSTMYRPILSSWTILLLLFTLFNYQFNGLISLGNKRPALRGTFSHELKYKSTLSSSQIPNSFIVPRHRSASFRNWVAITAFLLHCLAFFQQD